MEEILLFLRRLKNDIVNKVDGLVTGFDEWKLPWTQDRAEKLDSLDQVGNSSDADTMATVFGRLAEIKKISAERRMQIATTLGQMDVDGLSGSSTAKDLADGLDSIPVNSKETAVLTTNGQVRAIPRGYHHQGGQVRTSIANLTSSNIKKGINVGGVIGSYTGVSNIRVDYAEKKNSSVTMSGSTFLFAVAIRGMSSSPYCEGEVLDGNGNRWKFEGYQGEYVTALTSGKLSVSGRTVSTTGAVSTLWVVSV